jgi:diguanylate cyclase (GGDEF)-like protein
MDNRANFARIRFINGRYVEAALIQKGLMHSFSAIGSRMRKLHREGATDPLTGVVNRRGLHAAIDTMTEQAREVAVVMLDIDHFKSVNDNHGHPVGDEVLKTITALIREEVRSEDIVARMGGEEFAILMPETNHESARRFAERLRRTIAKTDFRRVGHVTASFGIACYPRHASSLYDTLNTADAALYQAKATGRNRVYST